MYARARKIKGSLKNGIQEDSRWVKVVHEPENNSSIYFSFLFRKLVYYSIYTFCLVTIHLVEDMYKIQYSNELKLLGFFGGFFLSGLWNPKFWKHLLNCFRMRKRKRNFQNKYVLEASCQTPTLFRPSKKQKSKMD